MSDETDKPNVINADTIKENEGTFSHPWNPNSEITGTRLSDLTGLSRIGVSLVRIAPGKESFTYHSHHREEEWIFILSGKGIAEINDEEYEVKAGDFMAFPTPSVPHHLRNPFADELSYLMGGETKDFEIADFPKLGKRMVRLKGEVQIYNLKDGKVFGPLEPED
ncbi:MAG: cupin domain-containing protein [Pseudomonadales bacterium]|nr:cupin domain-containing protein [Pseudomonadales bacterium]